MAEDEMQGLECIAALYASTATANASETQRMAALERLLSVCKGSAYPSALGIAI